MNRSVLDFYWNFTVLLSIVWKELWLIAAVTSTSTSA